MDSLSDYEKQKKVDYLALQWFPRGSGFWVWYATTIYIWKNQQAELDTAATIGLGAGILVWLIAKLILLTIESWIVGTYLWERGCGCLVRTLAIEVFQYLGIISICILAFRAGALTMTSAVIFCIIGLLNWFLISLKNL